MISERGPDLLEERREGLRHEGRLKGICSFQNQWQKGCSGKRGGARRGGSTLFGGVESWEGERTGPKKLLGV